MIGFLTIIGKEFVVFFRSKGLLILVLFFFTGDVYTAGSGFSLEARNISVGVVDQTDGIVSSKIISHLRKPNFKTPVPYLSQKKLYKDIKDKKIMVGIIFDADFETNVIKKMPARINMLIDTTSAAQSYLALTYLQEIIIRYQKLTGFSPIEIKSHKLFNPNSESSYFMALTELLSVITLLAVVLSAAVFVNEKENGTWEIMLLMPVDGKVLILAKILSQVIIIMLGTLISVGLVLFGIFNNPFNGSFTAFLLLTFFYTFSSAGIGLFVAALSRDILQVGQLSVLIMMPIIFLSGAWTPIYAMHPILQYLAIFSPLGYYIEGCQSLFFRGTAGIDLWPYFTGVIIIGGILFWIGFKKIGRLF